MKDIFVLLRNFQIKTINTYLTTLNPEMSQSISFWPLQADMIFCEPRKQMAETAILCEWYSVTVSAVAKFQTTIRPFSNPTAAKNALSSSLGNNRRDINRSLPNILQNMWRGNLIYARFHRRYFRSQAWICPKLWGYWFLWSHQNCATDLNGYSNEKRVLPMNKLGEIGHRKCFGQPISAGNELRKPKYWKLPNIAEDDDEMVNAVLSWYQSFVKFIARLEFAPWKS